MGRTIFPYHIDVTVWLLPNAAQLCSYVLSLTQTHVFCILEASVLFFFFLTCQFTHAAATQITLHRNGVRLWHIICHFVVSEREMFGGNCQCVWTLILLNYAARKSVIYHLTSERDFSVRLKNNPYSISLLQQATSYKRTARRNYIIFFADLPLFSIPSLILILRWNLTASENYAKNSEIQKRYFSSEFLATCNSEWYLFNRIFQ